MGLSKKKKEAISKHTLHYTPFRYW